MCANYASVKDRKAYAEAFRLGVPVDVLQAGLAGVVDDVWPGLRASFIRRPPEAEAGDEAVPEREALAGVFGLIPPWSKDSRISRNTYNARSETVAVKPSFREAWQRAQRCIIPAQAIVEPDWRSGRAVPTCIARADGRPMGIAGLWSWWRPPVGEPVFSFTMLTVNADQHALLRNFHKPEDEKRMVVILPEAGFADWLTATVDEARDFMRCYPAEGLTASPKVVGPKVTRAPAAAKASKPLPIDPNLSLF